MTPIFSVFLVCAFAVRQFLLHAMLDKGGIAAAVEAGGEAARQAGHAIGRAQQQRTGVGGDAAAVERRNDRTASTGAKSKRFGLHSLGIGGLPCSTARLCRRGTFADSDPDAPESCETCELAIRKGDGDGKRGEDKQIRPRR